MVIQFLFGGVAFLDKLINDLQFFGQSVGFFIILNPFLFGTQVFNDYFGFFGVVPKVRGEGFFFFVGNFYQLPVDVKDTSSAHQGAP